MSETFEQMALRVARENELWLWEGSFNQGIVRFATRIKEELCKGQEPTHWWNPKYPTLTIQLTKPHDSGGWEPAYSHPAPTTQEPVGGFRHSSYGGWQQVAKEFEDGEDVTKLYLHPAPIPADMVMVPREPTMGMYNAGYAANPSAAVKAIYRAMLAAYEMEQGK